MSTESAIRLARYAFPRPDAMPELPEVETVRRGLAPAMVGATILKVEQRRPDLRFPLPERFAARLEGRRVEALSRRAKYLLADLEGGEVLVMHLGMSGRFIVEDLGGAREPGDFYQEIGRIAAHDHVVFELSGAARITYNDVRRFGFMDLVPRSGLAESRHFKAMGLEPLGNEMSPERLAALFAGRRTQLKAALLDQHLIAGLGNIYVCEALHRAGLNPMRLAGDIVRPDGSAGDDLARLHAAIVAVLQEAIEAGGSTLRDFAHADGSLGYFQHRFQAYGREGEACLRPGCGGTIRRTVQGGRSTFHCVQCQG